MHENCQTLCCVHGLTSKAPVHERIGLVKLLVLDKKRLVPLHIHSISLNIYM